ncbi:MAG: fibronectin type III domain-containing protein, partial [Syntrophomonas sp.]
MSKNRPLQKYLAMMLAAVIISVWMPAAAAGQTVVLPIDAGGEIIAFANLAQEIAVQNVALGTCESELNLPETLTATVRLATVVNEQESGELQPIEPIDMTLSVTWSPETEYNNDAEGDYIFIPVLPEGYTLADGVELPQITVSVARGTRVAMPGATSDYAWYDDNKNASQFEISSEAQLKELATPAGIPSEPNNFAAVTGDEQIKLTWSAPSSDGGSLVTGYEVFSPIEGKWTLVGTATEYTFTGLTNGTFYTFQVRALNSIGPGMTEELTAVPRLAPFIDTITCIYPTEGRIEYGYDSSFQVRAGGTSPLFYGIYGESGGAIISRAGIITIGNTVPAGEHSFTIVISNGQEPDAEQSFTLTIYPREAGLQDLEYRPPSDCIYNGFGQGIGPVADRHYLGLTINVYYEGMDGTVYPKSLNPPKNAGSYLVTADVYEKDFNIWPAELTLAGYRIFPQSIIVRPGKGQKKEFGQSDPVFNYRLSSPLAAGDTLTGALGRISGENVGQYEIVMGTLGGNNNYTLQLVGEYFEITKAAQEAPAAPTLADRSFRSITLAAIDGAEYRIGEDGAWQKSPVFLNLAPNTSYIFHARLAETDTHRVSAVSQASEPFSTLKLLSADPPPAPTLVSQTATSITLSSMAGAEYRRGDDGEWQSSNEFTGLKPNKEYTFYARMKETDTQEASAPSEGVSLYTDKASLSGT